MIVSTILLSADGYYVDDDNNLPKGRPDWDKALLGSLVVSQVVSHKAYSMLPLSLRRGVDVTSRIEPTVGVTIPEIDGLTDLLIVVRSEAPLGRGKKFRLKHFAKILKEGRIEIWKRV